MPGCRRACGLPAAPAPQVGIRPGRAIPSHWPRFRADPYPPGHFAEVQGMGRDRKKGRVGERGRQGTRQFRLPRAQAGTPRTLDRIPGKGRRNAGAGRNRGGRSWAGESPARGSESAQNKVLCFDSRRVGGLFGQPAHSLARPFNLRPRGRVRAFSCASPRGQRQRSRDVRSWAASVVSIERRSSVGRVVEKQALSGDSRDARGRGAGLWERTKGPIRVLSGRSPRIRPNQRRCASLLGRLWMSCDL